MVYPSRSGQSERNFGLPQQGRLRTKVNYPGDGGSLQRRRESGRSYGLNWQYEQGSSLCAVRRGFETIGCPFNACRRAREVHRKGFHQEIRHSIKDIGTKRGTPLS